MTRAAAPSAPPLGFARAALAQDEFGACMVDRVARAVFGGPPSADAAAAMREELGRSHSIRAVARVALLREAAAWQRAPRDIAARWPPEAGSGAIEPSPRRGFDPLARSAPRGRAAGRRARTRRCPRRGPPRARRRLLRNRASGGSAASAEPMMVIDLASVALADCARLGEADRGPCLDRALRLDALLTPDAE